ncbi:MAG TPA: hypothetical protein VM618_13350 [Acidimicrobiia bacterium]|nr:hypothetical protein [Acidimicrobiia bacterium]
MPDLRAHGLAISLPPGWEGAIVRRRANPGEATRPVTHLATFPLPPARGDFGAGAVEGMGSGDVFVALFEYGPESVGTPLFSEHGMPIPLRPDDFHPTQLQRRLPGQAGVQRFFTLAGRAFSLYVVLGSHRRRHATVPVVNAVLARLVVDRVGNR